MFQRLVNRFPEMGAIGQHEHADSSENQVLGGIGWRVRRLIPPHRASSGECVPTTIVEATAAIMTMT